MDLKFRDTLPQSVVDELEQVLAKLRQYLYTEHDEDGNHGDVVAKSLRVQGAQVGELINLPYDASRFKTGGASVWTVEPDDLKYLKACRIGQLVFVQFGIFNSTIATDTAADLLINLPEFHALPYRVNGNPWDQGAGGSIQWDDADGSGIGVTSAIAQDFAGVVPSTVIQCSKVHTVAGAASAFRTWQIGVNNVNVQGHCWFTCERNNEPHPFYGS